MFSGSLCCSCLFLSSPMRNALSLSLITDLNVSISRDDWSNSLCGLSCTCLTESLQSLEIFAIETRYLPFCIFGRFVSCWEIAFSVENKQKVFSRKLQSWPSVTRSAWRSLESNQLWKIFLAVWVNFLCITLQQHACDKFSCFATVKTVERKVSICTSRSGPWCSSYERKSMFFNCVSDTDCIKGAVPSLYKGTRSPSVSVYDCNPSSSLLE